LSTVITDKLEKFIILPTSYSPYLFNFSPSFVDESVLNINQIVEQAPITDLQESLISSSFGLDPANIFTTNVADILSSNTYITGDLVFDANLTVKTDSSVLFNTIIDAIPEVNTKTFDMAASYSDMANYDLRVNDIKTTIDSSVNTAGDMSPENLGFVARLIFNAFGMPSIHGQLSR
jgi:hypothetical protein